MKIFINQRDDIKFVKPGFSWWALIFGPLWYLVNKIWIKGLIYTFIWILITFADSIVGLALKSSKNDGTLIIASLMLIQFVTVLYFAKTGKSSLMTLLIKKGYTEIDYLNAIQPEPTGDGDRKIIDASRAGNINNVIEILQSQEACAVTLEGLMYSLRQSMSANDISLSRILCKRIIDIKRGLNLDKYSNFEAEKSIQSMPLPSVNAPNNFSPHFRNSESKVNSPRRKVIHVALALFGLFTAVAIGYFVGRNNPSSVKIDNIQSDETAPTR